MQLIFSHLFVEAQAFFTALLDEVTVVQFFSLALCAPHIVYETEDVTSFVLFYSSSQLLKHASKCVDISGMN